LRLRQHQSNDGDDRRRPPYTIRVTSAETCSAPRQLPDLGTKTRVKVSGELRLLEGTIARLLKMVSTDVPAPESLRTVKARRAARDIGSGRRRSAPGRT